MVFFKLFSKISVILTHRTMKFRHKVFCYQKMLQNKNQIFFQFHGIFLVFFFIHKFKNDVFVHDFLSHQTSDLLEIWNVSKYWTNLKNNKDRFLKIAFLPFFTAIFRFFCRFSGFLNEKFSHLPHRTMKYWQSEYF